MATTKIVLKNFSGSRPFSNRSTHRLAWLMGLGLLWGLPSQAQALPPGFLEETLIGGLNQPTGLTFAPDGRMFIWEKAGKVWVYQNGTLSSTPLIDLSDEVTLWRDHGLLGFALDPNFNTNGYIYLLYAVDWGYLVSRENEDGQTYPFGNPQECPGPECSHDTIGRLTRYRCNNPATNPVVDPASRTILIGHWQTRRTNGVLNPPHITDGIAIPLASHGVDTLMFASDGTLLLSAGDGGAWGGQGDTGQQPRPANMSSNTAERDGILKPKEQIGSLRAQLVDCMNGKILRIDPATGNGVPGNPYYDPNGPAAPRSRVWSMGFRNPFRFSIKPGSGSLDPVLAQPGTIFVGDVGNSTWEEISMITHGSQNLGWPFYEGLAVNASFSTVTLVNPDAPNPLFGEPSCSQPFFTFKELLAQDSLNQPSYPNSCNSELQIPASYTYIHTRPLVDWHHMQATPQARVPIYDSAGQAAVVNIGDPLSPVVGQPFLGNCAVGGVFYTGTKFPRHFQNKYYFADIWPSGQWINMASFDDNRLTEIAQFAAPQERAPSCLAVDPQGYGLYYTHYNGETSQIRRLTYDCNGNGMADDKDLQTGASQDCNHNGKPDECDFGCDDVASCLDPDCNHNSQLDECEIADHSALDCNHDDILDSCQIGPWRSPSPPTGSKPGTSKSGPKSPSLATNSNSCLPTPLDTNGNCILDSCETDKSPQVPYGPRIGSGGN